MQLTQEHFDESLGNYMEKIESRFATMATKDDLKNGLKAQTVELKNYVQEGFEIQQDWMDERFKELIVTYDMRARVERLEKDVSKLKLGQQR